MHFAEGYHTFLPVASTEQRRERGGYRATVSCLSCWVSANGLIFLLNLNTGEILAGFYSLLCATSF